MALTDKLTAIANAIRSKTGKSDTMTLDQMVTEINSLGSGSDSGSAIDSLIDRSITEINSNVTNIGPYQ